MPTRAERALGAYRLALEAADYRGAHAEARRCLETICSPAAPLPGASPR